MLTNFRVLALASSARATSMSTSTALGRLCAGSAAPLRGRTAFGTRSSSVEVQACVGLNMNMNNVNASAMLAAETATQEHLQHTGMSRFRVFAFDLEDSQSSLFVPFDKPAEFERVLRLLRDAPSVDSAQKLAVLVAQTTALTHASGNDFPVDKVAATFAEAFARIGDDGLAELLAALPAMVAAVSTDLPAVDRSLLRFVRSPECAVQAWPRRAVFAVLSASFFNLWHCASRANFLPLFANFQFEAEMAKLRMIVHYFHRVATMPAADRAAFDAGFVTVSRKHLQAAVNWADSTAVLKKADFAIVSDGGIEDEHDALQADFANMLIGGGVLSGGNVQEEIRFAVSTECLVALLTLSRMGDEDSIEIAGASQWSRYRGYGRSLQYDGDCSDDRTDVVIACIDANDYRRGGANLQYTSERFVRELHKVYTAVSGSTKKQFATGNWGCGVFLGDAAHKSVLQWMACTQAGLSVAYFPFRTARVAEDVGALVDAFDGRTVGEAFALLSAFEEHVRDGQTESFVDFALSELRS
jgi:poly(ADP-ribose) glycohydrolase